MPKGQCNNKTRNGRNSSIPASYHAEIFKMDSEGKNCTEIAIWLIKNNPNLFKAEEQPNIPRRVNLVIRNFRRIQKESINKSIKEGIIKISQDYLGNLDKLGMSFFIKCQDILEGTDNLSKTLAPKYMETAIKFAEWKLKIDPDRKDIMSKEDVEKSLLTILEKAKQPKSE